MKSERAKQYIDNNAVVMHNGDRMVDASTAYTAIDIAEQNAEERVRAELTRWHDPKKEQPENNVCVLIKVADEFGNSVIYLASRDGNEYLTDGGFEFEIDYNDEPTPEMKIVGWREIL